MSLSDITSVEVNRKKVDVFMSYGVLNELQAALIEDKDKAMTPSDVILYPELVSKYLNIVLKKRSACSEYGFDEVFDIEKDYISTSDVEKVLDWASEHIMDFFVRRGKVAEAFLSRIQAMIPQQPSETGSVS